MRVRFADFVFDRERRELTRSGEPLHLTPKAFDLLAYLIERRPAAVSQEELFDLLWPDTLVDTSRIHQLVKEIRGAIGDDARRVLRTIHGRGYAFDGAPPAPALWRLVVGSVAFTLLEGENLVGRDPHAVVKLESPSVSRHHATVIVAGDSVFIEDLRSRNGTVVDGHRIAARTPVRSNSHVRFGGVDALVIAIDAPPPTEPLT